MHETDINIPLYTFDKRKSSVNSNLFNNNVVFYECDILKKPDSRLVNLCKNPRKKVLYCDNGDKVKEFKMYAIHLNSGDLLGVHDWGTEVRYEQVKDVLEKYEPVEHDLFEKNGWTTRFWRKR